MYFARYISWIEKKVGGNRKRKWAEGGRYKETGEIPCHERELEIFFGKPDKLRF